MDAELICDDCLDWLIGQKPGTVDLVFGSPPYEDCRNDAGQLSGEEWIFWAEQRYLECYRICRGLTAWVVEGKTKSFQWSGTPIGLMHSLQCMDVKLRKPPIYQRVGIPGSGGPDWLRNDYEFIICASLGKLPWSDNTVMGAAPKYESGGPCTHRKRNGKRAETQQYAKPAKTNPGNVIKCTVGGGLMGHPLAHENEAPFPLTLAEFFVRSFCPPGGTVLDPFCGSGTTGHAALKWGRKFIGIDNRQSQIDLTRRRLHDAKPTDLPQDSKTAVPVQS